MQKTRSGAKIGLRNRMVMVVSTIIFGILVTIFLVNILTNAPLKDNNDVSNWITLTVEIGVGISVALVILLYSNFQQGKEIGKLTKEVSSQRKEMKRWADYAVTSSDYSPEGIAPLSRSDEHVLFKM